MVSPLNNYTFTVPPLAGPIKTPTQSVVAKNTTHKVSDYASYLRTAYHLYRVSSHWFDTLILTPEEIAEHTLLPYKVEMPFANEIEMALRIGQNFIGPGLISCNRLNGLTSSVNLQMWKWVLENIRAEVDDLSTKQMLNRLLEIITQLIEFLNDINDIIKLQNEPAFSFEKTLVETSHKYLSKIFCLKQNQSLFISGGWINAGGDDSHALIYEFRKIDERNYDVILYSSTDYVFADLVDVVTKRCQKPLVIYHAVPPEVLFFYNNNTKRGYPFFIQNFIELHCLGLRNTSKTFRNADVEEMFDFLEPFRISANVNECGVITPQRGENCIVEVMKACIKQYIGHSKPFKQIIFKVKLKITIAVLQALKPILADDSLDGELARNLLVYASRNLNKRVYKMDRISLVDNKLANQSLATAQDIILNIAECEGQLIEQGKRAFWNLNLPVSLPLPAKVYCIASIRNSKQCVYPKIALLDISIHVIRARPQKAIKETIEVVKQRIAEGQFLAGRLQVHYLVDQFPLPLQNNFWNLLTIPECKECLQQIEELAILYLKCDQDVLTRHFATILTLHALTLFLAERIDDDVAKGFKEDLPKARLSNYSFPFQLVTIMLNGVVYHSSQEFIRIHRCLRYLAVINARNPNKILFEKEETEKVVKTKLSVALLNGKFWKWLLKRDKVFREIIAEKANNLWPDLSVEQIKIDFDAELKTPNGKAKIKKKANLPDITKQIMLLESMVASPITSADYEHIQILRRMVHLTNWALTEPRNAVDKLIVPGNITAKRKSPYSFTGIVEKKEITLPKISIEEKEKKTIDEQHGPMRAEHLQLLTELSDTKRNKEEWDEAIAEGRVLSLPTEHKLELEHRLLRTQSQWKLAPHQMIYEVSQEDRYDKLTDPSLQHFFFYLFLRAPFDKGNVYLGVGKLILKDRALVDSARTFMLRGLSYFFNHKNSVDGARFIFQLSFYLAKYLQDAGLKDQSLYLNLLNEVNIWLLKDNLKEHERAVLHLYRVLFILVSPKKELPLADLYASWILFQLNPITESTWKVPFNLEFAKCQIARITATLKTDLTDLANQIAKQLSSILTHNTSTWTVDKQLDFPYLSNGSWKMELAAGHLYGPEGLVKGFNDAKEWEELSFFVRLFGAKPTFSYHAQGGFVHFEHPRYGKFRLLLNSNTLQHWFPSAGAWYERVSLTLLPDAIKADYLVWQNPISCHSLITSLHDHTIRYCVVDVMIVEAEPTTGQPIDHAYVISELTVQDCQLSLFEIPGHILCFSDKQHVLKKMLFSRYTSLDGNPLQFIKKGDDFVWSEDVAYKLPAKIPSKRLKGWLSNYLYLRPVNGRGLDKLLLPFQPIKVDNFAKFRLDIHNETPLIEDKSSMSQEGRYRYFSYNIENDCIVPTSPEGKLFLAYVYLAQKRYEDAIYIINDLKPVETLSTIGFKIIELILLLRLSDSHPDANMVRLHAYALMIKQRDFQSKAPVVEYFSNENNSLIFYLLDTVRKNQNALNNISQSCRLDSAVEIHLLEVLIKEAELKKEKFINNVPFYNALIATKSYLEHLQYWAYDNKWTVFSFSKNYGRKFGYGDRSGELPEHKNIFDVTKKLDAQANEKTQQLYQAHLGKSLEWLKRGAHSNLVIEPPKNIDLPKNGIFFRYIYERAKNAPESERNALLFKLLSWRLHISPSEKILDLMIKVLAQPDSFPPLFSSDASLEEQRDFLQQLNEIYNKVQVKPQMRSFVQKYKTPSIRQVVSKEFSVTRDPVYKRKVSLPVNALTQIPESISFKFNPSRWTSLKSWKSYLTSEPRPDFTGRGISLEWQNSLLSSHEAAYQEPLKNDLVVLMQDYDVGRNQVEGRELWTISRPNCAQLIEDAQARLNGVVDERRAKELKALQLANQIKVDDKEKLSKQARLNGLLDLPITLEDCVDGLLSDNLSHVLNSLDNVNELSQLVLEIEDLKSEGHQLNHIIQLAADIKAIADLQDSTRRYLCQKLAVELDSAYHFDDFSKPEQVILRVMAGESGLLPFKKQTEVIKKLTTKRSVYEARFKDVVIQLMPGMGKSTLIAMLVLYLAAQQKDSLSLFLVPDFLLASIKFNLSEGMAKALHKKVHVLADERADLTLHRIEKIMELLDNASASKEPVISIPSTIQCFELEFVSRAKKFRKIFEEIQAKRKEMDVLNEKHVQNTFKLGLLNVNSPEYKQTQAIGNSLKDTIARLNKMITNLNTNLQRQKEYLERLAKIVQSTSSKAIALMDEVDLLLDCLQEVNFPEGEKQPIDPTYNKLMHEIFLAIVSDKLHISTLPGKPSIMQIVRLHENKQDLMSPEQYLQHVVPCIALRLAEHFKPIQDNVEDYQDAFVRYVSNQMPAELEFFIPDDKELTQQEYDKYPAFKSYQWLQLRKDLEFLKHLRKLSEGKHDNQKAIPDLIAQTRHFLTEVLKSTLAKTGGKDYTISPSGKIILLQTRDTPSNRDPGYHWEEAAYSYQYAAAFSAGSEFILTMAKMTEQLARFFMTSKGETPEENVEYQEFKRLTGIAVTDVHEQEKLALAVSYLDRNVAKRLEIQSGFIQKNVTYYPERLTSTGVDLLKLTSSNLAMSGNPWNVKGYEPTLANSYIPESGTEGQILHTMGLRANVNKIYEVNFNTIHEFMEQAFSQHQNRKRIRSIIDVGVIFKRFGDTLKMIRDIASFLEEKQKLGEVDPQINTILFFHKDPGELQPNTLYALKLGAKNPERIGGSTEEALKAKGLKPENYFLVLGEKQGTGIDVKHVPDAISLLTIDPRTFLRTIEQGIMRMRQFFDGQDVDLVIDSAHRQYFFNKAATVQDVVLHAVKEQSIAKTQRMPRYFTQQIIQVFKKYSINKLLECFLGGHYFDKDISERVAKYDRFITTKYREKPYKLHGGLHPEVPTKKVLQSFLQKKKDKFLDAIPDAAVKKSVDGLSRAIELADSLPTTFRSNVGKMTTQQELVLYQEIYYQQETELDIEQDVDLELSIYEGFSLKDLKREEKMDENAFLVLLQHMKAAEVLCPDIRPLSDQFKLVNYGFANQPMHYAKVFSQPIFGTIAYFETCSDKALPVFHKLQRPANQFLVIAGKDQPARWLLLSEFEAGQAKAFLEGLYKQNAPEVEGVWLMQPNGSLLEDASHYPEEEALKNGLLEINVFNGNASYLEKNIDETENWLANEAEIKVRFLKLKTARHENQNQALRQCLRVIQTDVKNNDESMQHIYQARAQKEKLQQGKLKPTPLESKLLEPTKVKDLHIDRVRYLGIDWAAEDPLDSSAMVKLNNDPQEAINLTKLQFKALKPFQVPFLTCNQMRWLPVEKIEYLEKPEQIYVDVIEEGKVQRQHYLACQQVMALKSQQKHLIPFVNPEYYAQFNEPWQIAAVPVPFIDKIKPELRYLLSRRQIKQMTIEQVDLLKNIAGSNWGMVHGDFLAHIPPQHLVFVCPEQIFEISDPQLIPRLESIAKITSGKEEGTWTSWISPEMVQYIDLETQVPYLNSPKQICNIPFHGMRYVTKKQVGSLSNPQLLALKACHPEDWSEWQKEIGETQIETFDSSELIDILSLERLIQYLQPEQVKLLKKVEQLNACPRPLLNSLSQDQIQSFNSQWLVDLLSEDQLKLITQDQVKYLLTIDQIQACPDDLLQYLDEKEQLPFLSEEQVKSIATVELFAKLGAVDDPVTESVNQMRGIQREQLSLVQPHQVKGLSTLQLLNLSVTRENVWKPLWQQEITPEQIKQFHIQEAIDLLNENQIPWVSDTHVHLITLDQVKGLTGRQLVVLKNSGKVDWNIYQQKMSDKQVKELNSKEQLNLLSNVQLEKISEDQAKYLSLKRINGLPKIHPIWKKLPDDKIAKVAMERLDAIPNVKLKAITNIQMIQGLPYRKVMHLTKAQLKQRTWKQFLLYTVGVIALGVAAYLITFIAQSAMFVYYHLVAGNVRHTRLNLSLLTKHKRRLHHYVKGP